MNVDLRETDATCCDFVCDDWKFKFEKAKNVDTRRVEVEGLRRARTHAQTDGQTEHIMPPVANKVGGGSLKLRNSANDTVTPHCSRTICGQLEAITVPCDM